MLYCNCKKAIYLANSGKLDYFCDDYLFMSKSMHNNCRTMMNTLLLVCAVALLVNDVTSTPSKDTLVLTSIFFRHGDRTPSSSFPNDPQVNNTYPPYGLGGLTLKGKRRSYLLGQNLRNRYISLLDTVYSDNLVEVISSAVPRTVMTVQTVLAALFPTNAENVVALGESWQPIYYTYIPEQQDTLIQTWATCPEVLSNDPNYQPSKEEQNLWDYVSYYSGVNITSPMDLMLIQDTLQKEEQLGYELPDWVKPVWPQPMRKSTVNAWEIISHRMPNTFIGNLLNKIADDSLQKAQGTLVPSERKLFIYGGHDANIVALLGALESFNGELVNYNAHLLFELHLINGQYGVKVFHKNGQGSNPKQVKVPGCGTFCPIESFAQFARKYKPIVYCA